MNISFRKSKLRLFVISTLLCVTFITDNFFSSEFAFVLFSVIILSLVMFNGFKVRLNPQLVVIFATFFCLGIIIGIIEFDLKRSVKDIWYFGRPILYFLGGALVFRIYGNSLPVLKLFLFIAIISAAEYLIPVVISFDDFLNLGPDDFRDKYGKGSALFTFGIAFCFYYYDKGVLGKKTLFLFILIFGFSLFLIQSRLSILMLLFFLLAKVRSKLYHNLIFVLLFSIIILFSIPKSTVEPVFSERQNFVSKTFSSLNELRPQKYIFDRDIHTNWRGHETYVAMTQFYSNSLFFKMVGGGFGSTVYIDFEKRGGAGDLSETRLSQLDWLHNGYVTILLKTGLLGFIAYIVLCFKILARCRQYQLDGALSSTCLCFLYYFIVSTFLIGGLFAKSGTMILLFTFGFIFENLKWMINEDFTRTSKR